MVISRLQPVSINNIRAFFDIETNEGFTLKGFKIVEGSKGLFVSFPSQKNKDGEYNDTVWATKEVKAEVHKMALDSYDSYGADEGVKFLTVEDHHSNDISKELPF